MTLPKLSLTRAKLVSVISWAIVVFFECIALFFPVKGLPIPLKIAITTVLLATVVAIIYTTLSSKVEKPDERAAQNNYKANSMLYDGFFLLFGFFVLLSSRMDIDVISLTRSQIILLFAVLNLLHDGIFLLYERFGS